MSQLDDILEALDPIVLVSFFYLIYTYLKYYIFKKPNLEQNIFKRNIGIIQFILIFAFVLISKNLLVYRARQEYLRQIIFHSSSVELNNVKLSNTESYNLISDLKKFSYKLSHGSHPETKINLCIINTAKETELIIYQDSQYKDEYWIFWHNYKTTINNSIGKIESKTLTYLNNEKQKL